MEFIFLKNVPQIDGDAIGVATKWTDTFQRLTHWKLLHNRRSIGPSCQVKMVQWNQNIVPSAITGRYMNVEMQTLPFYFKTNTTVSVACRLFAFQDEETSDRLWNKPGTKV